MPDRASQVQGGPRLLSDLDEIVEAFEIAWNRDGDADVAHFLPPAQHPQFGRIALELLCVDLERRRRGGHHPSLEDYQRRFPQLLSDRQLLERLAFEEYRLGRDKGAALDPEQYAARWQIDTHHWPRRTGSTQVDHGSLTWASAAGRCEGTPLDMRGIGPDVGQRYLGFEIVERLGTGKFAQVFLARQLDLSERPVVLKVTTARWRESERLARLQHTNIVPVYSVHQCDDVQVVCMPFWGRHTLADAVRGLGDPAKRTAAQLIDRFAPRSLTGGDTRASDSTAGQPAAGPRTSHASFATASVSPEAPLAGLRRLTYEQLVLWIVARIASALAHAHQRGILHRDLKPANILLTDSGQPLILDFNLSDDLVPQGNRSLLVGGTLPYMAPEHLRAMAGRGQVDPRSDVYSLGVILFQLLAGQLPFSPGRDASPEELEAMVAERSRAIPSLRAANRRVSPAVESLVRHCLAPDPARRYQSADELREDLERQLDNLPLKYAADRSPRERARKCLRRHPRLTSSGGLGLVAATVLLVVASLLLLRTRQLGQLEASRQFDQFQPLARTAIAELYPVDDDAEVRRMAFKTARQALSLYGLDRDDWQTALTYRLLDADSREQLDQLLIQLLFVLAQATSQDAIAASGRDNAVQAPRTEGLNRAWQYNQWARELGRPLRALVEQQEQLAALLGHAAAAASRPQARGPEEPDPLDDWLSALDHAQSGEYPAAGLLFEELTRDDSNGVLARYLLGVSFFYEGRWSDAEECFLDCTRLSPDWYPPYFSRGLCLLLRKQYVVAEREFSETLRLCPEHVAAQFNRGLARMEQDDYALAVDDFTAVLDSPNSPLDRALVYLQRSEAYRSLGDERRAREDHEQAMVIEPIDEDGWIRRGLARLPDDPQGALADVDRALELDKHSLKAWQNRAHIFAQYLDQPADAIAALDECVRLAPNDAMQWVVRGLLRARTGDRAGAIDDASQARKLSPCAQIYYLTGCTLAQTSRIEPSDAIEAVAWLQRAGALDPGWLKNLATDRDLLPLADDPWFRELLAVAK